jgi:hypothetical protein
MGFVGVWYCINPPGGLNATSIVLIGYCFFFSLFMVGVFLRI